MECAFLHSQLLLQLSLCIHNIYGLVNQVNTYVDVSLDIVQMQYQNIPLSLDYQVHLWRILNRSASVPINKALGVKGLSEVSHQGVKSAHFLFTEYGPG